MTLPKLFEDRMKKLLGEEFEEYLQCYQKPHFGGLRVNTLKLSPEDFENICPFPMKRIPWITNGYYYDTAIQPARHPYYYAGLYYIQEPSAMTPASLLPISKKDKVLDLCAAPGGKSTELGARLGGEGLLVANDISNSRAKALLKNIELFGIRNSVIMSESPSKLVDYFPEYFDKILIDAPCSGEGMFRKNPAMMKNWEEQGVDYYNALQKEIIIAAAKMLKPGGYMLYSTCTFAPEEDECTITYLLDECPEFHVVNPIPKEKTQKEFGLSFEGFDCGKPEWMGGREELKNCVRLWPHKIDGEGHFIALLHKEEKMNDCVVNECYQGNSMTRNKNVLSEEALDFISKLKIPYEMNQIIVLDERVYLIPKELPELKGLRILRQGLLLGEMKKQRFEPAQALANALSSKEFDKIIRLDSDDLRVIKYLKCETIDVEGEYQDGWQLICVDDFPLGWGKLTKGILKNKYFPGWRWM